MVRPVGLVGLAGTGWSGWLVGHPPKPMKVSDELKKEAAKLETRRCQQVRTAQLTDRAAKRAKRLNRHDNNQRAAKARKAVQEAQAEAEAGHGEEEAPAQEA